MRYSMDNNKAAAVYLKYHIMWRNIMAQTIELMVMYPGQQQHVIVSH